MRRSVLAMACQISGVMDAVEKGRTCRQSADDTVTLAKWKKELAALEKR